MVDAANVSSISLLPSDSCQKARGRVHARAMSVRSLSVTRRRQGRELRSGMTVTCGFVACRGGNASVRTQCAGRSASLAAKDTVEPRPDRTPSEHSHRLNDHDTNVPAGAREVRNGARIVIVLLDELLADSERNCIRCSTGTMAVAP